MLNVVSAADRTKIDTRRAICIFLHRKKVIFVEIQGSVTFTPYIVSIRKKVYQNAVEFKQDFDVQVRRDGHYWLIPFCDPFKLADAKFEEMPDKVVFLNLGPEQENYLQDPQDQLLKVYSRIKISFDEIFMCAKLLEVTN